MLIFKRSLFVVMLGLVLGNCSPARAEIWGMFSDGGNDWVEGPYVPNMIGGDSLGIPYDNGGLEARLTYQHFLQVAENNSPIPRDRVAFGYKYYDEAIIQEGGDGTLGPDEGHDIQEFQVRVEKTFLDGNFSAELILPWQHTTSSRFGTSASTPNLNSEMGNIGIGLKALLWDNGRNYFTTGLLVEAPTADDRKSLLFTTLDDDVWFFSPYIAFLSQPTDRFFVQGFTSFRLAEQRIDETVLDRDFNAPNIYQLDLGTGYLAYQNDDSMLRAITPTIELHYTHSLEEASDSGFYYDALGQVDFLTLTAGATTQLGDNTTLAAAFLVPLRESNYSDGDNFIGPTDRQFDWAFMLQLNVFTN